MEKISKLKDFWSEPIRLIINCKVKTAIHDEIKAIAKLQDVSMQWLIEQMLLDGIDRYRDSKKVGMNGNIAFRNSTLTNAMVNIQKTTGSINALKDMGIAINKSTIAEYERQKSIEIAKELQRYVDRKRDE